MQLVLVSGLSGSGKSIALDVLEDSGYYCVDNLPATLLGEVVRFLDAGGYARVAVSVDARSVALSSLPQQLAELSFRRIVIATAQSLAQLVLVHEPIDLRQILRQVIGGRRRLSRQAAELR